MTFQRGTSAGYLAFLQDLIQVATNSHVDSAAVNAGGTGYAVGDILAIDGGTSVGGHTAAVEVLTLSGSAVATVRIYRGGAYTVNPGTGATTTAETGVGTGCTIDTTIDGTGWTVLRRTQEAVSATVNAGGTGYSVNDKLTLDGGLIGEGGTEAVFNVDSLSGSAVATVSLDTAGNYEEDPGATGITTTVAPSGGSGCTLDVTYQDADTQESVVILEGEGLGGTDQIYVGLKAYELANGFDTAFNLALVGFTGFNSALLIENQVGISPGLDTSGGNEGEVEDLDCVVVPLKDTTGNDITWWASINGRRIIFVCKVDDGVDTNYMHGHLGLLNELGTNSEYPYPLYIAGSSSQNNELFNETTFLVGGLSEPVSHLSSGDPRGCAQLRHPSGAWVAHAAVISNLASVRNSETEFGIFPVSSYTIASVAADQVVAVPGNALWSGMIPVTGNPASPTYILKPTANSGAVDQYVRLPVILFVHELPVTGANFKPLGEIDNVLWIHTGGNAVVSEDRLTDGSDRYTVFRNGNRGDDWSYLALKEE